MSKISRKFFLIQNSYLLFNVHDRYNTCKVMYELHFILTYIFLLFNELIAFPSFYYDIIRIIPIRQASHIFVHQT